MYLKSLTLKGFKSFADKTQMVFDPGLTVVVGPNGSGKSNISDAILWVLGEQSAKMLRGQAMEDVIFSGSSARQAVGLAEVTLVLDNEDRTLPIDFSDIAITRRMYRSGESEYLINGAPSRLMDIQDILHDSGLGKETHSIISQGKLDEVLASRPEDRRELIEEAAGISKHQRRLARSSRKLKAMDDNLRRAKDIQHEIARQLRPLERQVDKAKRHRELTEQLREISCTLAVDDLRDLQRRYAQLQNKQKEADAAIELAQYRFDEKSHDLERYQSLLEQKGIFVGDLGEQRRRMQDTLGRMDSDMRLLEEKGRNMVSRLSDMRGSLSDMRRQRADAADEHEKVAKDLADSSGSFDELTRQVSELEPAAREATKKRRELGGRQARLTDEQRQAQREADQETLAYAKLADQVSNAQVEDQMYESRLSQIADQLRTAEEAEKERGGRRDEASGELERAKAARDEAASVIEGRQQALKDARAAESAARDRLAGARASLKALEAVDERSENASGLARELSSSDATAGLVESRLADLIDAPEDVAPLVERLLGDDLSALVAADDEALARLAASALASKAKGSATIVAREAPAGAAGADASEDGLPGAPLLARLQAPAGSQGLLEGLFGKVRVVSDAAAAIAAHAQAPGQTYISEDGAIALPDGRVLVGQGSGAGDGVLERKRRIRELDGGMAGLEQELKDATAAVEAADQAVSAARDESAQAKGEVARLEGELRSLSSELGRIGQQKTQAASERAQVTKAREKAAKRVEQAKAEIDQHRKAADDAKRKAADLAGQIEDVSQERSQASRDESKAQERLSQAKLDLATVRERRSHLQQRERELAQQLKGLDERIATTERSAHATDVLRLRVEPLHKRYEAIQERALDWAARLKDRASLAEADSDSLKKTISEAKEAVNDASQALERAKSQANDVKVEIGRLEVQVENAIKSITDDGYVLEEALELPEPDDREAMERAADKLRRQIDSIGPVNEVAMDEYDRLKQRADYIDEQVADLESARKALRKIASAIERKMRKQFLATFDKVNQNFADIFGLLFPGGRGHLEMTDPDHLSETGIEIVAQPRGKRITKMTLMSGGEKSLTALALLFAVYRTRTVPFYVFDEIEAALDDANLSKLLDAIEQLKQTTQLIVISHQRRTMEDADVLYGVSMHADGVSHVVSQRLDHTTGKVVDA